VNLGQVELLSPGDIQPEDVHAVVLGGEPAHHLHALLVGLPWQRAVFDSVASVGLFGAVVHHLLQVLFRRAVQRDRGMPPSWPDPHAASGASRAQAAAVAASLRLVGGG
jgi:hypothetical protein